MNKEPPKTILDMSNCESTMEIVMKNIYTSCDPQNLNEVPTSEIIDFIRPYMLGDLSALETLKIMLDPYSKNERIDGEKFYKVMNEWAKKIASHSEEENSDGEFNQSASQLNDIDDKILPYTQSTPRASFGQKLLSCQDLLNLSNVSHYNLSPTRQTKDNSLVGSEKTILEEELKQLQYELNKVLGEMGMLKVQLAYSEEQNEYLHDELEKLKTRLQSEPQINGHLEENKNCVEDVKEEVNLGKKRIEELNKKLTIFEKDYSELNMYVKKLEKENTELEDRCEHLTKTEQNLKKELIDIKNELDMKEHELTSVSKINEDLRQKLHETKNEVDQLLNENELLDSKKQGLEKILTSRRYSLSSHYNTCLDEMSSFFSRGSTIPIYSSPLKNQSLSYNTTHNNNNDPSLIQNVLSPLSPKSKGLKPSKMLYDVLRSSTPKGLGMRKAFSLNAMSTRSMPNIFCSERSSNVVQDQGSEADGLAEPLPLDFVYANGPFESLQTELFQVDPQFDHKYKNGSDLEYEEHITTLKNEIESLQNKVQTLLTENKILSNESKTSGDKLIDIDEKFKKIISEKRSLEERISNLLENKTEETRLEGIIIRDECNKLKSELVRRDKQIQDIENKFDFESAYKSLEGEYGRKISLIDELHDNIFNLTNVNNNLKKSLQDCKEEIQETKEKLKIREMISANIEQTANKVQLHVEGKSSMMSELQKLNNDFKLKIDKLEKDVQDKMKQLSHLKDILKREEVIKNKMWSDNQDLNSSLKVLTEEYQKLLSDIGENENIKKELKEDYNVMLSKYNQEMEKNKNLASELSSHQKDLTDISSKYHKLNTNYHVLVNNNLHVLEELSYLKSKTKCIKEHHKLYKDELNKSLHEYQNALQLLSSKLKDLEFENNILRTDLSIEKQKFSKQAVCDDKIKAAEYEDSGFKCGIESETSSESSLMSCNYDKSTLPAKNLTFEKQKLTIDRLRDKLDDLESILLNERSKNDILKERLTTKEDELREGKVRISTEKNSLQSVINDLKDKLAQQDDYYKHITNASSEKIKELSIKLSQYDESHKNVLLSLSQKESLLQRNFEMFEYNKITIEKLHKSVQDFQIQHKNLSGDIRLKEISLKHVSLENQNLKHLAARLNNQLLEQSVKLSYIETALKNCEGDLCKKSEELTSLTSLLSDREERIRSLTAAAEDNERRLSDSLGELSIKDSTCANLELELKELQDKLSRTETCRDKARADVIRMEENINSVEIAAEMTVVKDDSTFDQVSEFVDVIAQCCNDLNMAFTKFIEQWKNRLELDPNFKTLPALKLCSSFDIGHVLSVIVDNVKVVILLFNILSSNGPSTMEENPDSYVNYLSNTKVEVNEPKVIRKFTLRPSKLDVRPVSPDSPGIEIEQQKIEEWKPDSVHNSPDSQNCRTFELGDDGEQSGRTVSSTHLPLLTFDLQLQDAFPHLSDSFLDKLGLHETSPKVKLSKDETERLFTTFAIQVALDSKDIKDRLQKQKDCCSQVHRKFVYLLKDISVRLREHKCIGATDSINPVFVMLEDVRYQMQEMMQTVGQFGVLTCENRMTKCWNLVTNYMAIIRQNTEFWKEQSSPNRLLKGLKSSTNSPEKVLLEKCQKCEHLKASKDDKKTKEYSIYRSCYSKFTRTLVWLSYVPLLFFVGMILVHFQCKMNTVNKVCPMDDFIKVLSQTVGNPPY